MHLRPLGHLSRDGAAASAGDGATDSGNRTNMRGLLARLLDNAGLSRRLRDGELSEWPKEPDSKSGVRVTVPRVRIPRSPPQSWKEQVRPAGPRPAALRAVGAERQDRQAKSPGEG